MQLSFFYSILMFQSKQLLLLLLKFTSRSWFFPIFHMEDHMIENEGSIEQILFHITYGTKWKLWIILPLSLSICTSFYFNLSYLFWIFFFWQWPYFLSLNLIYKLIFSLHINYTFSSSLVFCLIFKRNFTVHWISSRIHWVHFLGTEGVSYNTIKELKNYT